MDPSRLEISLDIAKIKAYGRKMTTFAEWCAGEGMPISYHHHMAAAIETERELDLLMANSGEALQLLFDAGLAVMILSSSGIPFSRSYAAPLALPAPRQKP